MLESSNSESPNRAPRFLPVLLLHRGACSGEFTVLINTFPSVLTPRRPAGAPRKAEVALLQLRFGIPNPRFLQSKCRLILRRHHQEPEPQWDASHLSNVLCMFIT